MRSTDNLWAIVPAAGVGTRMGAEQPKQYLQIAQKTVLEHSVEKLVAALPCTKVVLCVGRQDDYAAHVLSNNNVLAPRLANGQIQLVVGGATRAHSVLNGLQALSQYSKESDWVLVHDAARPCVDERDLKQLYARLKDQPIGGILATRVHDTLKLVHDGAITKTLPREQVWQAQTPQMFKFALLFSALKLAIRNSIDITDEASALEYSGVKPLVVGAQFPNPKITTPADIGLATALLSQQAENINT